MRCLSFLFFLLTLTAAAQVMELEGEFAEAVPMLLAEAGVQLAIAPAGGLAALLEFTVEAGSTKGDMFDIVTGVGGVPVSLVLPNGTEITSASTRARGFTFTTLQGAVDKPGPFSPLSIPGTHTLIALPTGAPPGIYRVKVDGRGLTADTEVVGIYVAASKKAAAHVRALPPSSQDTTGGATPRSSRARRLTPPPRSSPLRRP